MYVPVLIPPGQTTAEKVGGPQDHGWNGHVDPLVQGLDTLARESLIT